MKYIKMLSAALLVAGASQVFAAEDALTEASKGARVFAQRLMDRNARALVANDVNYATIQAAGFTKPRNLADLNKLKAAFQQGLADGANYAGGGGGLGGGGLGGGGLGGGGAGLGGMLPVGHVAVEDAKLAKGNDATAIAGDATHLTREKHDALIAAVVPAGHSVIEDTKVLANDGSPLGAHTHVAVARYNSDLGTLATETAAKALAIGAKTAMEKMIDDMIEAQLDLITNAAKMNTTITDGGVGERTFNTLLEGLGLDNVKTTAIIQELIAKIGGNIDGVDANDDTKRLAPSDAAGTLAHIKAGEFDATTWDVLAAEHPGALAEIEAVKNVDHFVSAIVGTLGAAF